MIRYFFQWYSGNVWGNLIASTIWAIPAYLYGRYHMKKIHKKHDEMHQAIKDLKENINGNTN